MVQDSLQEVSQIISAVLPEDHVIGQAVARIAEGNLSEKTRRSLREQEELIQVMCLFKPALANPHKVAHISG